MRLLWTCCLLIIVRLTFLQRLARLALSPPLFHLPALTFAFPCTRDDSNIKDLDPTASYKYYPVDPAIRGAIQNLAAGHEVASTHAIANDPFITNELGEIKMVNNGRAYTFRNKSLTVREFDGILVADDKRLVLVNSAKLGPTPKDALALSDVAAPVLLGILSRSFPVTNLPPELQHAAEYGVVPFLSGNHFSEEALQAAVDCRVIPVTGKGDRFHVWPSWKSKEKKIMESGVVRGLRSGVPPTSASHLAHPPSRGRGRGRAPPRCATAAVVPGGSSRNVNVGGRVSGMSLHFCFLG